MPEKMICDPWPDREIQVVPDLIMQRNSSNSGNNDIQCKACFVDLGLGYCRLCKKKFF